MKKGTGQKEVRPVWNNTMRSNHQSFSNSSRNFTPTAVLTKSGIVPINAARQSSSRAAAPVSAVRSINIVASKTFVNSVNTAKVNKVTSAVGKQGINVVKSSACWVWRPKSKGDPQVALKDTGIFDSGCSQHMTGNKSYLIDYPDYDGGFVALAGSSKGGRITGKGTIRTGILFEDVYFVKELKFNLFSVSQMCDRKNSVLFIETECLILSPGFKLPDESQVLLKVPRKNNMYSFDLKNVVPSKVVTDDYSRFSWVFFLTKKDETSRILKDFITGIENQLNYKVKIVRCDNGTEFKNYEMNQFCGIKGIKREFSNARTPQQNGVAERKNRTLIEAARTMLADSLLPIPFWAEAVNTACYVQNRVLVTKPHNRTPYELLISRTPIISFMRPFGCPVTILNTLGHLGKFDGKTDEGFLVGYSIHSKAFRVFNSRTRKVEENLHVNFLENKPNIAGTGPEWLFDIDSLTSSMNYQPVSAGNRTNDYAGSETNSNTVLRKLYPHLKMMLARRLMNSQHGIKEFEEKLYGTMCKEKLYGTMCLSAADYTSWILRLECKSCQVMKMGLEVQGYLINDGYADLMRMLAVVISESSVRSDLLLNDEDVVTCLTNDKKFVNLALMGYEQPLTKLTFQK
ncbi:ribonuclease H-like domain-containing protein, partial [Tanacetum coccineum]